MFLRLLIQQSERGECKTLDALNVIEKAQELGISLQADGEYVYYRPEEAAPPEFVEALRQHKTELLAYYTREGGRLLDRSVINEESLLAYATELSEHEMVLTIPVSYVEVPQRAVTTVRVSWYATHYLKTIISARHHQQHPGLCWGQWTPGWWQERELEAIGALNALRGAVEVHGAKVANS